MSPSPVPMSAAVHAEARREQLRAEARRHGLRRAVAPRRDASPARARGHLADGLRRLADRLEPRRGRGDLAAAPRG